MKIAFWLLSLAAMVILLACIVYCWTNRSGHTAINPLLALAFFGPVFVIGIVGRMITPTPFLPHPIRSKGGFKALPPKAIS